MSRLTSTRPSAAFVVAVLALCFAIVGSAIAGTDASKKALSKSQVKKIAKKQANKAINKAAPGLSVDHANSADTATSATTSTNSDAPFAYAHIVVTGSSPNVDEAQSKGITDADVADTGTAGLYCVKLPDGFKGANGTQDEPFTTATDLITIHVLRDTASACAGAGFPGNVIIFTVDDAGALARGDFDLTVYK